ncbi:MAG TPA: 4Fe-4S single cluster domain-containing protein [Armatimonadota bacterium]|nr:4Fe-4S single cluster domain-containing protein [Armatimonadota bacterium]
MTAASRELNIGLWRARSTANGPGTRFVLWLQGCDVRCPGCFNPEFQPLDARTVLPVNAVAAMVLDTSGIEGVSYSGGEPTRQAGALAELSERLREGGLSVLCFSGHTLEALRTRHDPDIDRLLRLTDILIDGPYLAEQAAALRWRGSRNQRVHFLTPRYQALSATIDEAPAEVELAVDEAYLSATGIWPPGFLERLKELLQA